MVYSPDRPPISSLRTSGAKKTRCVSETSRWRFEASRPPKRTIEQSRSLTFGDSIEVNPMGSTGLACAGPGDSQIISPAKMQRFVAEDGMAPIAGSRPIASTCDMADLSASGSSTRTFPGPSRRLCRPQKGDASGDCYRRSHVDGVIAVGSTRPRSRSPTPSNTGTRLAWTLPLRRCGTNRERTPKPN